MPTIYPFPAIQYGAVVPQGGSAHGPSHGLDASALIAPPYDVLDASGKAALLAKSDANIVAIDLPHLPAKELGPDSAYSSAALRLAGYLQDKTLVRRERPCMFIYRQHFEFAGRSHARTGLACTLDVRPFGKDTTGAMGGGILPHEQTFSGPKEDRLALMRATRTQLSPIFGLHPDVKRNSAERLRHLTQHRPAEVVATTGDGTRHELWTIDDPGQIQHLTGDLAGEDVFIADGHHRYTTAINYLAELEVKHGPLPADHPARRCMFVLISMHDQGLVIGPTHRVLAGMGGYAWPAFERASKGLLDLTPVKGGLGTIEGVMKTTARHRHQNVLGLYDFQTGHAFIATPTHADPLKDQFATKPQAWRTLDVAICQHLIVERICQSKLMGDGAAGTVRWAFPHSAREVEAIGRGEQTSAGGGPGFEAQLAVIVDPTPLEAVREISLAGELMPQKSTFFYPKLATGLFMHALS
jgi:uncharacterized protein (DUF1015 family)